MLINSLESPWPSRQICRKSNVEECILDYMASHIESRFNKNSLLQCYFLAILLFSFYFLLPTLYLPARFLFIYIQQTGALDQQKEMYEQKLEELRREKTPDSLMTGRTSSGYNSEDRLLNSTPTSFYDRSVFWKIKITCCADNHEILLFLKLRWCFPLSQMIRLYHCIINTGFALCNLFILWNYNHIVINLCWEICLLEVIFTDSIFYLGECNVRFAFYAE